MTVGTPTGLTVRPLRRMWAAFLGVDVLLGAAAGLLTTGSGHVSGVVTAVVAGIAVVDLAVMGWFRRMGEEGILSAVSNEELRAIYTKRFLLTATFALSPAVVGFALGLGAGAAAPALATVALSFAALLYTGPRPGDLRRIDERMVAAGRPFRLSAALEA